MRNRSDAAGAMAVTPAIPHEPADGRLTKRHSRNAVSPNASFPGSGSSGASSVATPGRHTATSSFYALLQPPYRSPGRPQGLMIVIPDVIHIAAQAIKWHPIYMQGDRRFVAVVSEAV